ncbi:hypothetical protein BJY01DRAFT_208890, partial [Aspergillus pseudoustus]
MRKQIAADLLLFLGRGMERRGEETQGPRPETAHVFHGRSRKGGRLGIAAFSSFILLGLLTKKEKEN